MLKTTEITEHQRDFRSTKKKLQRRFDWRAKLGRRNTEAKFLWFRVCLLDMIATYTSGAKKEDVTWIIDIKCPNETPKTVYLVNAPIGCHQFFKNHNLKSMMR